MARQPLQVLLRLRGIALDQARRELADRLREETAAAERCASIAATIARETELQGSQPAEGTSDSYAAWLTGAHIVQREAAAANCSCIAATAEARASLNAARADTRALEAALERVQQVREGTALRLEQRAVDEAAAGCKRPERWSG